MDKIHAAASPDIYITMLVGQVDVLAHFPLSQWLVLLGFFFLALFESFDSSFFFLIFLCDGPLFTFFYS